MKYVEFVNKKLSQKIMESERVVLFGQNTSAGSCLSGLTRNLQVKKRAIRIYNTIIAPIIKKISLFI